MSATYRCEFRYTLKGQAMVTGLDYQTDVFFGIGSEPSPSEVATEVDAKLTNRFLHCLSTLGVLDSVHVRERVLGAEVPATHELIKGSTGLAALGAQEVPLELCGLIARKTAAAIKSGHGWMFMPPVLDKDSFNSEGQLAQGTEYEANLQLFAALLDDDISSGVFSSHSLHPVVYSQTRHRRDITPYTFKVTAGVVRRKAHFLRRREAQPV